MHETSKAVQRRLHDSNFISRYFVGHGIDIGAGDDPLGQYIELFPLMKSCLSFDRADGDAEHMPGCKNEQFDFVHSSHCLEDLSRPEETLKTWFRILKPGGHLIVTVPDEDMYEQGVFPSTFNSAHKWCFSINKVSSWSKNYSVNLVLLLAMLGPTADLIKIERLTATYRFGMERTDQTRTPIGEAAIEFVVQKRKVPTSAYISRNTVPKIALYRPGAIGDVIMTLSLIPLLKQKYPDHDIYYFCHPEIGPKLIRLMLGAGVKGGRAHTEFEAKRGEFEHVFNLIGYPLQDGYPEVPMKKHLIQYFADEMGLDLDNPYPITPAGIPFLTLDPGPNQVAQPYATIHPQAGWSHYKNWPNERWEKVIAARRDIRFYQIGSAVDDKLAGADCSFLGRPLDESIDLMAHAAFHVGIDSWTNHLTNISWRGIGFVPAVILWGSTQASAAGYPRNINISQGLPCQPCFREDPKISGTPRGPCINPPGQTYEDAKHACMAGITVEAVLAAIEKIYPTKQMW